MASAVDADCRVASEVCSFGYCVHAAQKWLQPTIHHPVTAAQIFLGRVAFRVADSTLPRICSSAQRAACSVAAAIGTLSPGATSWFDHIVPPVILPWPATCPHLLSILPRFQRPRPNTTGPSPLPQPKRSTLSHTPDPQINRDIRIGYLRTDTRRKQLPRCLPVPLSRPRLLRRQSLLDLDLDLEPSCITTSRRAYVDSRPCLRTRSRPSSSIL